MSKRKSLSKKTRFEIFKRDLFTCQYCGRNPPSVILHVDHINPVAKGGDNDMDNLVTSCKECNQGKGANSLEDIPQSLKDKSADIKEREDQISAYNEILMEKKRRLKGQRWDIVEALEDGEQDSYNKKRLLSIETFLKRLPFAEVLDAAETTNYKFSKITDHAFRYFCAICWSKIKESDNA